MWQRFNEESRKAVFYAQEEAQGLHDGYVATEHLLLGLIHEPNCRASLVLEKLGLSFDQIRADILRHRANSTTRPSVDMTLDASAKAAIGLCVDEAKAMKSGIGSEHLLLGLIREEKGLGARVLTDLGVELESARKAVLELEGHA